MYDDHCYFLLIVTLTVIFPIDTVIIHLSHCRHYSCPTNSVIPVIKFKTTEIFSLTLNNKNIGSYTCQLPRTMCNISASTVYFQKLGFTSRQNEGYYHHDVCRLLTYACKHHNSSQSYPSFIKLHRIVPW